MTRYSDDDIENIRLLVGGARVLNMRGAPSWMDEDDALVFEIIGLDVPQGGDLTEQQVKDLLKSGRVSDGRQSEERINSVWRPYINASLETSRLNSPITRRYGIGNYLEPISESERHLQIIGGTSGTFKSTFRRMADDFHSGLLPEDKNLNTILHRILPKTAAVHIDPDEAKIILPEYRSFIEHGVPGGANYVHSESRELAQKLLRTSIRTQDIKNIVYDSSGQFNEGAEVLSLARNNGISKIDAVYFFADLSDIKERLDERESRTGRNIPSHIPQTIQSNLQSYIPSFFVPIEQGGLFDSIMIYDTSKSAMPYKPSATGDGMYIPKPVFIAQWNTDSGKPILEVVYTDDSLMNKWFGNSSNWYKQYVK